MYKTRDGLSALEIASQIHADVNQTYGKYYPYRLHLEMVTSNIKRFFEMRKGEMDHKKYLEHRNILYASGAYHDLIEDCRLTYNELLQMKDIQILYPNSMCVPTHNAQLHEDTINLVYACTELRGMTRAERHGEAFKDQLYRTDWAWFVKLCDTLANASWSKLSNSSMLEKYEEEVPVMLEELFEYKRNHRDFHIPIFQEMVREFEFILGKEIEL